MNKSFKKIHTVCKQCTSLVRDNILLFVFLLIYILFHQYWEDLIGEYIVDKYLCHIKSSKLNDLLYSISSIYITFRIFYHCFIKGHKYPKQRDILIDIIVILFWIYYRFISQRFYFIPLYSNVQHLLINTPVMYVDIVSTYIFFDMFFILFYRSIGMIGFNIFEFINYRKELLYKKEYPYETDRFGFFEDTPIEYTEVNLNDETLEDNVAGHSLRRHFYAKKIVTKLGRTNTDHGAYTCGIDAPWGAGKTSLMNMMKQIISNQNSPIIIDFNPWSYSTEKNMMTAFIDELSGVLKEYDSSLASNLIDYSRILSTFDTKETKMLGSLINLFHQNDTLQNKKQKIIRSIKRIKRFIYIFIDDLDRLDADELLEMMKLIRNISDFPHIYIIAAYNKTYLVQCLNSKMKTRGTYFVEKFFQYEFHLPPVPLDILCDLLLELISIRSIIEYDDKKELENYLTKNVDSKNTLKVLSNIREVKRLANSFSTSYEYIGKGINIIDLLLFELFKNKYPLVFSFFEEKKDEVLEIDELGYYNLYDGENKKEKINFIKYIENNRQDFYINDIDLQSIKAIFERLFQTEQQTTDEHLSRFNNIEWFNRYINLSAELEQDISDKEFNTIIKKDFSIIRKNIHTWMINKSYSLGEHLRKYNPLDKDVHLKLIQSILLYSLLNFDDKENKKLYNKLRILNSTNYVYTNDDRKAVIDILTGEHITFPINFNFEIIYQLYKDNLISSILTKDDVLKYHDGIKNLCLSSKYDSYLIMDEAFKRIRSCCFRTLSGKKTLLLFAYSFSHVLSVFVSHDYYLIKMYRIISSNIYMQNTDKVMKNYILENILDAIPNIIYSIYGNVDKYTIKFYYVAIFGSWNNFYKSIVEIRDDTVINDNVFKEFKKFLNSLKNNRYKSIRYSFEHITPSSKQYYDTKIW